MSGYPLRAVWELRRREEKVALERLAQASRAREEAETDEARRIAEVRAARQRHALALRIDEAAFGPDRENTGAVTRRPSASGAATAEQARYVARRHSEVVQAEAMLDAFRSGLLAEAHRTEDDARKEHLVARRAREAFDKHQAKFQQTERRATERREDEASDDIARGAKKPRG